MKSFYIMLVIASALLSMTACNTVKGVGEDLEEAGDAVKDATS